MPDQVRYSRLNLKNCLLAFCYNLVVMHFISLKVKKLENTEIFLQRTLFL